MNNYFSHDSNARNSDKLIPLRMKLGAEGYGIYFMLLERLRDEKDYMSIKDYNMLAFDLRVDASKVKSVIEDFRLFVFTEDGKYFYSEGFKKRMDIKDIESIKRSEAGKKGAAKRWGGNCTSNSDGDSGDKHGNAIAMPSKNIASKVKESKEKKSKIQNQSSIFSTMISDYTANEDLIESLNDFIAMRYEIKKPLTQRALEIMLKKLTELSGGNDNTKIKILENSVMNSWQGIFALKNEHSNAVPIKSRQMTVAEKLDEAERIAKERGINIW
ncbi:MAG: DUF4373 domain-containing protein [Acholeplasmataceae bacterium]|nr:DUF4373 domain-containing protein [Acholeplasmataceae bacterium]